MFKQALRKRHVTYQLFPPHVHSSNAAERVIRTFKNHFISILATADPMFPVSEWDRQLPQAELTLSILRTCKIKPKLSAFAYLFGPLDFNRTPLAPINVLFLVSVGEVFYCMHHVCFLYDMCVFVCIY